MKGRKVLVAIIGALLPAAIYVAYLAASATLLFGCTTAPLTDAQHRRIATAVSNAVQIVTDAVGQAREARRDEAGETGGDNSADPVRPAEPAPSGGAAPLVYKYGGFRGENAVEDPNTQISDLHMTKSGMRYKWANGSLKNWGLANDAAGALACVFFWDGKQWIGGKFDWVSTSRTNRDFKNINEEHYHGWDPDKFWSAKKRAFCIVSKDGKRRTNLLETNEP